MTTDPATMEKLKLQLDHLQTSPLEDLHRRIEGLESRLSMSHRQFDMQASAFERLQSENDSLTSRLGSEAQRVRAEMKEEVRIFQEQAQKYKDDLVVASSKFEALSKENMTLRERFSGLSSHFSEIVASTGVIRDLMSNASETITSAQELYQKYRQEAETSLTSSFRSFSKSFRDFQRRIEASGVAKTNSATTVQRLENRIAVLEESLAQRDETLAISQLTKRKLEARVKSLEGDVRQGEVTAMQQKREFDARVSQLESQLAAARESGAANLEEREAAFAKLKQRNSLLSRQLGELRGEKLEIQARLEALEELRQSEEAGALAGLRERLQQSQKRLATVQKQLQNEGNRANRADAALRKAEEEHALALAAQRKEAAIALEKIVAKAESERQSYVQRIRELEALRDSGMEDLQLRSDCLEASLASAEEKCKTTQAELQSARLDITQKSNQLALAREDIEELKDRLSGLQYELDCAREMARHAADETVENRSKLRKAIDERDAETRQTLAILEGQLSELTRVIKRKDSEVATLKRTIKRECAERHQLLATIDQLRSQGAQSQRRERVSLPRLGSSGSIPNPVARTASGRVASSRSRSKR